MAKTDTSNAKNEPLGSNPSALNPGARYYDQLSSKDSLANAERLSANSDRTSSLNGSESDSQENLQNQEESGNEGTPFGGLYKAARKGGGFNNKKPQSFFSRMLYGKNLKPITGIGAAVGISGTVLVSLASGGSFWAGLEKGLTNENANDARTNLIMHRAFNNMFKTDACKKSQLVCRFKTASKEYVKKLGSDARSKVFGTVVDKNGNPRGGVQEIDSPDRQLQPDERVIVDRIITADGSTIDSAQAAVQAEQNPRTRTLLAKSYNGRTASFLSNSFSRVLSKFKISKASATADEKKLTTAEERRSVAEDAKNRATENADPKKNVKKTFLQGAEGWGGIATGAFQGVCMLYNITNITIGAVKAKWVSDLVRFGWPFMRIIAQAYDGSLSTEEAAEEMRARLTQLTDYMSPQMANELIKKANTNSLSDSDKDLLGQYGVRTNDEREPQDVITDIREIQNRSALDSVGIMSALYGDNRGLTDFVKQFSTAAMGAGIVTADSLMKELKGLAGGGDVLRGKRNIRSACILNNAIGTRIAAANITTCLVQAATIVGAPVAVVQCGIGFVGRAAAGIAAYAVVTKAAEALLVSLIANSPALLRLDLKGPAAGDALAAGIGLLLTRKSHGSGLKPAMSLGAINAFIVQTEDIYQQYTTDIARYEAKSEPFNPKNQYSFLGQIIHRLSPYPQRPDKPINGFGYVSNIFGAVANNLNPAAMALQSQPSLLTISDRNLRAATNNGNCIDDEKNAEGMMCLRTGQTVNVTSPRVLQWAQEESLGKKQHLVETIEWMQKTHEKKDENSGGTGDETCNEIANLMAADFSSIGSCDNSWEKASIDEDGKPVPGSQFEKYITYCTERGELEMGSTDLETDVGSLKEQYWHSGRQCAKTYDCKGVSSNEDNFDKNCDTGVGSLMMDRFAYYYNMCYVQYSAANGVDNCFSTNTQPRTVSQSSQSVARPSNGTIALDPGHSAEDILDKDLTTGAALKDYPNGPELADMWDIANRVKAKLEQEGYTVKMLRSSINERVNFRERADRARGSSMAISIHSTPLGGSTVSPQFVGGFRVNDANGKQLVFQNSETATKSQACANQMARARSEKEGGGVVVKNLSFEGRQADGLAGGDLPWVMLLSPDTPWVYNEMQPSDGGGGANGMSETAKNKYTEGIVAGIKACNLPKGTGSSNNVNSSRNGG